MNFKQAGIRVRAVAACALLTLSAACAYAQTQSTEQHSAPANRRDEPTDIIFLNNITTNYDLNDIQTAIRNVFPWAKIYGVQGQNAIVVKDTAEDIQAIKKLASALDLPKKIYRVTYTVSDVENGKRSNPQRYSLVIAAGSRAILKQGKRVPLATSSTADAGSATAQATQLQYIDVGVNIDATIEGQALKTKLELSAVSDEKSGASLQAPVIQQSRVENTSSLTAGKPVVLGSLAVPGTTRHQEVEVTTELLPE